MGWLGSPRRRWYLLAVAWIALLVLGMSLLVATQAWHAAGD